MQPADLTGRGRLERGPPKWGQTKPGQTKPCQALALGLLQGPTELLPVSSSAHTALIPRLAGWSSYTELAPEQRKSFEVALHLGAGVALALDMRSELIEAVRELNARRVATIALSLAPAMLAGYALERPIEQRLGGRRAISAGLVAGGIAMALADAIPIARHAPKTTGDFGQNVSLGQDGRHERDAGPLDGLALGVAQAVALMPGVSRSGATLTAARARGFAREDAHTLSWHVALPVILGAGTLKGWRLLRTGRGKHGHRDGDGGRRDDRGVDDRGVNDDEVVSRRSDGGFRSARSSLAIGAASAFASTWASARVLRRPRVSRRSLLPWAVYRCVLAAVALHQAGRDVGGAQNMKR